MSIDSNHPDYIDLRVRIRENPKDFVAIVGSGLSRPCGLPSWSGLRDILVKNARDRVSEVPDPEKNGYKARLDRISKINDMWICFSELKEILPRQAYEQCIKENLALKDKKEVPVCYDLLWKLNLKGILTYNIDTCVIDSYARVNLCAVDTATGYDSSRFTHFLVGPQQFVFQPHGHISDPSSWVFTSMERNVLLQNEAYKKFMQSLCQTKHLLIVGFNPSDFAFNYLIQNALTGRSTTGSRHYIFIPLVDPNIIRNYDDQGFAVIPYLPGNSYNHPEIEQSLRDFIEFIPQDDIPPTVFNGGQTDLDSLPSDDKLIVMPIHESRELLNKAVASIIPPDSIPQQSDVDKLEKFYKDHFRAIHMAWLIEPKSECDVVHGYKIIQSKARGAFGQVYEAENIESGDRVALKVLLPEVKYFREYLNSFRRGVRSMKILTQNKVMNMVRYIDAFEIPACVFMEYIDGPTLTEAKNWKLLDSISKVLDILVRVGGIVHSAHNLEERVLHRDLKPDNIILRNGYDKSASLDVVVLDFDLSWHKGASELSVVHGARAQGYAAPEQTATGMKSGISTRNTAVDVFGYGMLAFFLLVGDDPKPNEQSISGFQERIKDGIRNRYSCNWRCLPNYLARTIKGCTKENQPDRIAFSSAVEAFREAQMMTMNDKVTASNPLVLEEMAAIIEPDGTVETREFGRILSVQGIDPSKRIELRIENEDENIIVNIDISKVRSEGEQRNVAKYLENAKSKALSKLNFAIFKDVRGVIGQSCLNIIASIPMKEYVSGKEIQEICNRIIESRMAMNIG
jgi:serine/threonine protein kinase